MSNRVKLEQLDKMAVGAIAQLPVDQLVALIEDADDLTKKAKKYKDWLGGALGIKYDDKAKAARKEAGKDTGIIHIYDGDFDVTVDVPKKVTWDEAALIKALQDMTEAEADHYAKWSVEVAEAKFTNAPPDIQKKLSTARTVGVGKPTIKIAPKKQEAA